MCAPATRSSRRAFTYLELIITAAIIAAAVIASFGIERKRRESRELQQCLENLRQIHVGLQLYATEHDGAMPGYGEALRYSDEALGRLTPAYLADPALFVCPASRVPVPPAGESFAGQRISYDYRPLAEWDASDKTVILTDHGLGSGLAFPPHPGSRGNILHMDGSCETVASSQMQSQPGWLPARP